MTVTLVIPWTIAAELDKAASAEVESAGVLLARCVNTPSGDVRLLGRQMYWVPESAYHERTATALSIASHGYVPFLRAAELDGSVPIWLHTHPGPESSPLPSYYDEDVDKELSDLFRLRSSSPMYGSVVLAHTGHRLSFTGHIESAHCCADIDHLWIVGPQFAFLKNWTFAEKPPSEEFDRNIRAFGGEVQQILSELHVAVVGCGGTGSAVTEQLTRLGVRQFSLFDPGILKASNVTRVYGSFPDDIGRAKVEVTADHVSRITPDAKIAIYRSRVTELNTAMQLVGADVVFGCTDDNAGRLVLSRLASYLLTPVIDCGVLLDSGDRDRLEGIYGRITLLAPGAACLVCRNRIELLRAAAEMLPADEHQRLVAEGYAPALQGIEPAVVAFTTIVAATAVGELLERLIHYGSDPPPTEILLRTHDREMSTNILEPRDGHYCHPASGKLGLGLTEPFLEQTWQQ